MTHDSYRELVQRAIDEDLSSSELALLNEHVATCADCRREWDQYKSLVVGLSKLSKVMPEKSYVGQIAAHMPPLSQLPQPDIKVVPLKRRAAGWWRTASVAAVVLLAVGLTATGNLPGLGGQHSATPETKKMTVPVAPQYGTEAPAPAPKTDLPVVNADAKIDKVAKTVPAAPARPTAEPQLIAKETVQDKRQAQVVVVAMGDLDAAKLDAIQSQTGVQVKPADVQKVTTGQDAQPPQKALDTVHAPAAPGNHKTNTMLVVTVDSTPTDVHVDGDKVTMTLVPDHNGTDMSSEIKVFGVPTPQPTQPVVLFTDDHGNPITPQLVDLPPSPAITGPVGQLEGVDNALQSAASLHPEQAGWATAADTVVRHYLSKLGFAETAAVAQTVQLGRVLVTQGGMNYEVSLVQPFAKGPGGIWQPAYIARLISPDHPLDRDRPIIEWSKQLGGTNVQHGKLLVLSEWHDGRCQIQVEQEQLDAASQPGGESDVYDCRLKQLADGTWMLDGAPVPVKK